MYRILDLCYLLDGKLFKGDIIWYIIDFFIVFNYVFYIRYFISVCGKKRKE